MPTHTPTATRGNFLFGVALVLAFGAVVLWRQFATPGGDHAPTPAAFAQHLTLASAQDRSATSSKPVLVYATASWCGPCKRFKAQTLSQATVTAAITKGFEPVYLDIDDHPDIARNLRVMAVPTLIVLRDGEQVDRASGYMDATDLLAFLARQTR